MASPQQDCKGAVFFPRNSFVFLRRTTIYINIDINFRLNLASVYRAEKSSIFIPPSFPDCWAQKTKLWQNYSLSENVEFHEYWINLIGPLHDSGLMVRNKLFWDANNAMGLSKQRNAVLDWYEFLCFGSPTALFASQHNLFRTMRPDRVKGLLD